MSTVRSQVERHPLPTFFAATLGFGWLLTIAAAALSSNPVLLPLIAIPVSFVPAVDGVARAADRWHRGRATAHGVGA